MDTIGSLFFALATVVIFSANSNAYMSKEAIIKELKVKRDSKSLVAESLDDKAKEREKNLISKEDLLRFLPKVTQVKALAPTSKVDDSVDLRDRDTSVKSQDNGKCSAYGGVAVIENLMQKDGIIKDLDLSEWHAWSFYRQYSAPSFISSLSSKKIGDEKFYPQYKSMNSKMVPYVKISKYEYLESDTASVLVNLMNKYPIYIAMQVPNSMLNCPAVIDPNSSAARGGHAIAVSGYILDDKNQPLLILKNSWGSDCGDKGYQYLPISICKKKGFYCDFWVIKELEITSNIPSDPTPTPTPAKKCYRSWRTFWRLVCE